MCRYSVGNRDARIRGGLRTSFCTNGNGWDSSSNFCWLFVGAKVPEPRRPDTPSPFVVATGRRTAVVEVDHRSENLPRVVVTEAQDARRELPRGRETLDPAILVLMNGLGRMSPRSCKRETKARYL